ncbi:MAG: DUF481 domain-containing protein [Gemmatimonadales bacterium]|nr:DUF481 domain-containing protein [Gemmatimonadales bacterium]
MRRRSKCAALPLVPMLAAVALSLPTMASAQVNIEQLRRDSTDRGVSGSLGFDLAFRTGNVDIVKIDVATRLDYAVAHFRTFVAAGGDFGWESGNAFSSEAILHVRQVFRSEARAQPELFEQLNYDKLRALTFRAIFGGGMRFTLLRAGGSGLWFGTGYMYEREHLDLPAGALHPDRTSSHRWSNYVSARVGLADETGLVWTVYAQPRFDDFADIRVLADTRLVVNVSRHVGLVNSFLLRWDSGPPDEIEALDTTLRTGLRISF